MPHRQGWKWTWALFMYPAMPIRTGFTIAALAAVLVATPAFAQQAAKPKPIGVFGDWDAWEIGDGRSRTCFVRAKPKTQDAKGLKRTDIVQIQVSIRPADKVKNEVGVYLGYPIKPDSKVQIAIDKDSFDLSPSTQAGYRETAWIHEPKRESDLVDAMMKGSNLVLKATSERSVATTDTYSLKGISAGLKAIADRCK